MFRGKTLCLRSGILVGLLMLVTLGGWGWVGTEQVLAKYKVPYKIADIAAVLWPNPSIFVRSGDILSYEVHLKNYGPGKASHVYVQIPFNPNHVTPIDCSFQDSKKGWVDEILTLDDGRGHVQLEFKDLKSSATFTAVVRMRVANNLPNGTIINGFMGFGWKDEQTEYTRNEEKSYPSEYRSYKYSKWKRRANASPVIVSDVNNADPFIWIETTPTHCKSGEKIRFFTNRFAPFERFSITLHFPDGHEEKSPVKKIKSNSVGKVWITFDTSGLKPGSYQVIIEGQRSKLKAIPTIVIDPPTEE